MSLKKVQVIWQPYAVGNRKRLYIPDVDVEEKGDQDRFLWDAVLEAS